MPQFPGTPEPLTIVSLMLAFLLGGFGLAIAPIIAWILVRMIAKKPLHRIAALSACWSVGGLTAVVLAGVFQDDRYGVATAIGFFAAGVTFTLAALIVAVATVVGGKNKPMQKDRQ
jgi:hypothetical protein